MRKIVYKLVKEDYQNWVHWNVERNYSEKKRRKTILVFVAIIAAFIIGGAVTGRGMASVMPTVLMGIIMGGLLLHTTSFQSQEKMVWKRSGLNRLEQTGNYPIVTLTLKDRGMLMEVANQDVSKAYSYKEIVGIEEIDRLFLIETTEKTWQFVAKSGFGNREEMDEFVAFMKEKIAAAKENPEDYSKEAMEAQENGAELPGGAIAGEDGAASAESVFEDGAAAEEDAASDHEEDDVVIRHVDTSNMGKIGKMAHIMAAMAAEDASEKTAGDLEEEAEAPEETADA